MIADLTQYNFKHKNIHETIRCQRNFDWNNPVTLEHLEILDEYVQKPGQQQGEHTSTAFKIYNNYEKVQELNNQLHQVNEQVLAPLVYVFTSDGKLEEKNPFFAGFNSGIVAKVANELGYQTGFCLCGVGSSNAKWKSWCRENGLDGPHYNNLEFILSIGHPEPGKNYNDNGSYCNEVYEDHEHFTYNWSEVKEL